MSQEQLRHSKEPPVLAVTRLAGRQSGLAATECSRTLLDLGAVADEEVVEMALECAGCSISGRGHGRPAQSVLEVKFIRAIRQVGLPHPQPQLCVKTQHGRRFIDFAFPTLLLGIEVGGRDAHSGPAAEQRDSRRHNELTGLGWRILYFTWDDIDHRIDYVIACIEESCAHGWSEPKLATATPLDGIAVAKNV